MPGNGLIGRQLGDYKIVASLGQGGMAHVYKGYDENLDRYAAVKVIEPAIMPVEDEAEYRERFSREARAIARLNHPRIVGVYQFGKTEQTSEHATMYYMAMVFVEGRDLRQVLKEYTNRKRRMSNAQVLRIMRDIGDSLDYAHEMDVIHRDVKPSNIMITNDGRAVLTDFGLALRTQEGTMGNTFGSVHYIAPEQAVSSSQANAQSDLYSLGIVLYEILTGRVPFDDNSAMSIALSQIQDPPPPPRTINPAIPEEVEAVILKALEKEPENRYLSGLSFVQALERAFAAALDEETHDLDREALNPFTQLEKTDGYLVPESSSAPIPSHKDPLTDDKASKASAGAAWDDEINDDVLQTQETTASGPPTPRDKSDFGAIGGVVSSVREFTSSTRPFSDLSSGSRVGFYIGGAVGLIIFALIVALVASSMSSANSANATSTAAAQVALDEAQTGTQVAQLAVQAENATATAEVILTEATSETGVSGVAETPTDAPTSTPTDVPTDTPTSTPTATPTDTPTDTPTPSNTPTNTNTPTPTDTPTHTPTHTPAITTTPEINSLLAEEPQVLLRYDGRTLVVYNRSQETITVANLVFAGSGGSFSSNDWSSNRHSVPPTTCYQLWSVDYAFLAEDDFPADICTSRRGFNQTSRTFWLSPAPSTFEVRRGNLVLGECPTIPANEPIEMRCLIDIRPKTTP